ncbi:unnamed protein product [Menidia menidia]|uniref:(Atlantic silverside) hypothetical protein n=1 Tax=Menidia menidia TaxID=238744 RepID=A0A8S4BLV8_9TELE|nr:unnamed protein product [Menidia menidia]
MSAQELFVTAARKFLCVGRKSLSTPQCLQLAAQVSAVDVGLKPAVLYDSNGASAAQIQQYLSSLRSERLVSGSLATLDLNGNGLVINTSTARSHLERVLCEDSVAVMDVCHGLGSPAVSGRQREALRGVTQDLLPLLQRHQEAEEPLCVGARCEEWNLCTVFGLLLGYPVTYWFDQTKSFENCLSMTPLVVTTASARWQADASGHRWCLFSFSFPASLQEETRSEVESWRLRLTERFEQQHVLKELKISQSSVTLPSVCL